MIHVKHGTHKLPSYRNGYEFQVVQNHAIYQDMMWIFEAAELVSIRLLVFFNQKLTNQFEIKSWRVPAYFAVLDDINDGLENTHRFYVVVALGKYQLAGLEAAWRRLTKTETFQLLFVKEEPPEDDEEAIVWCV